MILAAGLGTRLRPLTDATPKALITVGGTPMLEHVARRLIAAGVDRLVINAHHHADQVVRFVDEHNGFGVDARISREPDRPLETGGGLLHAREHFRLDRPVLLHNVDVLCRADLRAMTARHVETDALATLAVQRRPASRFLRFDDDGLQARVDERDGSVDTARPVHGRVRDRAFAGIHVIAPRFFDLVTEDGYFSIIEPYLRLAGAGHRIVPHDITGALWLEVGDPDRLERAREVMRRIQDREEK